MEKIKKTIEKQKELIKEANEFLWGHPETGFKEYKTSEYLEKKIKEMGYDIIRAENIPGFYTILDTGKKGPEILILAELDAVICKAHPESDKKTGAVHACGHHGQCVTLLAIAGALCNKEILDNMCGRIRLCFVPAEELLKIEERERMIKEGKIKYMTGKCEFLKRGYFDNVDLAFMAHFSTHFAVNKGTLGSIAKKIIFKGKSAHAGGQPEEGKNALYAAMLGMNAINALRETFTDEDKIRVHPIIIKGGEAVNSIPHEVIMEMHVRAKELKGLVDTNKKVDRALIGAGYSLDVDVKIENNWGYAPLKNDENLMSLASDIIKETFDKEDVYISREITGGSTDMGDLSALMPVIHLYVKGSKGKVHGEDYYIENPVKAFMDSAYLQLSLLFKLLSEGGKEAERIISEYKPRFSSKEEYFGFIDRI